MSDVPEKLQEIFWEGACVVAAHQFFRLNDLPGFVEANGYPNPAYKNNQQRMDQRHGRGLSDQPSELADDQQASSQ